MRENKLDEYLIRLNELEPGLRSLDTLFALGAITKSEGEVRAGDFDFYTWGHCLDGFSVGAIVRTRLDGHPFPMLIMGQKKWVLCSKGEIKVIYGDQETVLSEGCRLTILPKVPHEIHPVSKESCAIIVTVPADPAMS